LIDAPPPRMLTRLIHRIVANPGVYDLVQFLAGASVARERVARQMRKLGPAPRIADVGGGTGAGRQAVGSRAAYVCLDIDPVKVRGFVKKYPDDFAVVADATRMPLADRSLDAVIFMFVAHHLDDELLRAFVREAARVLKSDGVLVFVDPLWAPRRWLGRLLWRFDRGSRPRTGGQLSEFISAHFEIVHVEWFAVWHEYALAVGRPRAAGNVARDEFTA
jgi:ubiquinone/menaquinone biosynthesis C-methylase UbiE